MTQAEVLAIMATILRSTGNYSSEEAVEEALELWDETYRRWDDLKEDRWNS